MMIGLDEARQIAEQYLIGLSADAGVKLELPSSQTLERDFGWVFYYGPEDTSLTLAGNAPFIVDRKDGSIHVTGTAYPTGVYLENYDLTGTAFPPGVPEDTVVLEGWKPSRSPFPKISLTKAIRAATEKGLAESKGCADSVLSGEDVGLMFPTAAEADKFSAEVQRLGRSVRRGIR
ncbi:MAG TPA: hypothetical protein VNY05_23830 [Candidatus Acidoferrales bacterium]|nr:hypothetical protein [Candidatus Acidoferrales bacterium]